ncbi:MAG: histidine phosphatase family protein [Proteobacteria bacterium]|nr:histidine phosphatase family protein [Pseudomonadota bacterium]
MSILLIRHGETALNAARVVQPPETPLSERGLAQARRLAERLQGAGITRIVSSDLARAAMTAACVAEATRVPIEHTSLLQERNFGDVRGTPYADLEVDLFGPDYAPPGGEDWDAFHARVEEAWRWMRERASADEGPLAVVTHGLVCHSIVARLVDGRDDSGDVLRFDNTSLTTLERAGSQWRAVRVNCTVHLDAAVAADREAPSGI